jgi:hypothetical protein
MTPVERAAENHALRAEAVAIRNELVRLDLVSSLATKLLQPLPPHATARVSSPDPRGNGPTPPDGNHRARVTGVFVALAERERVEPSAEPAAR